MNPFSALFARNLIGRSVQLLRLAGCPFRKARTSSVCSDRFCPLDKLIGCRQSIPHSFPAKNATRCKRQGEKRSREQRVCAQFSRRLTRDACETDGKIRRETRNEEEERLNFEKQRTQRENEKPADPNSVRGA